MKSRLKKVKRQRKREKGDAYILGNPDNNAGPHANLVAGVIKKAVDDYLYPSSQRKFRHIQNNAKIFIYGSGLDSYCNMVGIEPDFIRRKVASIKKMEKRRGKI